MISVVRRAIKYGTDVLVWKENIERVLLAHFRESTNKIVEYLKWKEVLLLIKTFPEQVAAPTRNYNYLSWNICNNKMNCRWLN